MDLKREPIEYLKGNWTYIILVLKYIHFNIIIAI
jgi:hypothetical protein